MFSRAFWPRINLQAAIVSNIEGNYRRIVKRSTAGQQFRKFFPELHAFGCRQISGIRKQVGQEIRLMGVLIFRKTIGIYFCERQSRSWKEFLDQLFAVNLKMRRHIGQDCRKRPTRSECGMVT
jgi:hypothetical protein